MFLSKFPDGAYLLPILYFINPCPPEPFAVTCLPKGRGLLQPHFSLYFCEKMRYRVNIDYISLFGKLRLPKKVVWEKSQGACNDLRRTRVNKTGSCSNNKR